MFKPKVTSEEWAELKVKWENDPRIGYAWLIKETKIGVTRDAIRKKAEQERWRKSPAIRTIVQQAHINADNISLGKTDLNSIQNSIKLRSDIIELHRKEWNDHRRIFTLLKMEESLRYAQTAKMSAEVLKLRQDGERRAWALDAVAETEVGHVLQSELDRIYKEATKRMIEMEDLASNQFLELNGNKNGTNHNESN